MSGDVRDGAGFTGMTVTYQAGRGIPQGTGWVEFKFVLVTTDLI